MSYPVKSITSRARRPKNSWFVYSTKVGSVYEWGLGYKNSKGYGGPYSASTQSLSVKIPFGPPSQCSYVERKDSTGELIKEYQFVNRKMESVGCNELLLNNFETKRIDPFNMKVNALFSNGQKSLLANYLSAAQCSKDFVHHCDKYDDNGLKLDDTLIFDKSNVNLAEILKNGGSIEELEEFIKLCRDNAIFGESIAAINKEVFKQMVTCAKRSFDGDYNSSVPAKIAKLDAREMEELMDNDGLEQNFKKAFLKIVLVSLDNISLCKDLKIVPNENRVSRIAESIRYKYDPPRAILGVIPSQNAGRDCNDNSPPKFEVIQKVHTFEAFKKLDQTGDLVKLNGHESRKVMCFIINTDSVPLMRYGHSRSNNCEYEFCRKDCPQDLLHVFASLVAHDTRENALELVQRMSKLGRIGFNEDIAIRKFCKWNNAAFDSVIEVVSAYEKYLTLDVQTSRAALGKYRGDRLTIPNAVFNKWSRIDEDYFMTNYRRVLSKEISLKDLIEEHSKAKEVQKVYCMLSQLSGFQSIDVLKDTHPDKFTEEVVSKFIGADLERKNSKASMLEEYYNQVVNGSSSTSIPIEIKSISFEDSGCLDVLDGCNVAFLSVEKSQRELYHVLWRKICSSNSNMVGVFLFPNSSLSFDIVPFLRSQRSSLADSFQIIQILFSDNSVNTSTSIVENVKYGLIFGNINIFNGPLEVYYNSLDKLPYVLEKILPPLGKITAFFGPGVPMIKVHDCDAESSKFIVRYYGESKAITKFEKKLLKDRDVSGCQIRENCDEVSYDVSTSSGEIQQRRIPISDGSTTSPFKPSFNSTQESGFGSQENNYSRSLSFSERIDLIAEDKFLD